jgi:hypothetical protein
MRITAFAVTCLMASIASAQNSMVLRYAHTEGTQNMQEIATMIRTIADIREVSVDADQKTLTLNSGPDQIKLAEWIFGQVDAPNTASPAKHDEFRMPGDAENVVSLMYLHTPASVQEFQEVVTAVRTVADIRRVFTYNAPMAVVMRGSEDQIALGEWLVNEIDQPLSAHTASVHAYRMAAGFTRDESAIRVFYLAHTPTVQEFQEVATAVRTIADIRRVFTYNAPRAMIVRGTPDQITLSAWLVDQLDTMNTGQPRQASPIYTYQTQSPLKDDGSAIRVFFLNHAGSTADFQKAAVQVRTTAQIRRVFTYNGPRALVLRGSTDQLSVAEQLVKDIQ